jgi:hypothetical protein
MHLQERDLRDLRDNNDQPVRLHTFVVVIVTKQKVHVEVVKGTGTQLAMWYGIFFCAAVKRYTKKERRRRATSDDARAECHLWTLVSS